MRFMPPEASRLHESFRKATNRKISATNDGAPVLCAFSEGPAAAVATTNDGRAVDFMPLIMPEARGHFHRAEVTRITVTEVTAPDPDSARDIRRRGRA
jgi:hypothetical protein